MTREVPAWVGAVADDLGYPTAFVTVSGAHLYGFASVDSDVDLRAVHLLPPAELLGLETGPETLQRSGERDGVELDVVSHDLGKFLRLLLRPNGYVLEQLLSPLVIRTGDLHRELVSLAPRCLTRHHANHYRGFAQTQWSLFERTDELKPALYTLRVLLTGIHLMRTGAVEANLGALWPEHALPYAPDLIAAKAEGEHRALTGVDRDLLARDVQRLLAELESAAERTHLPDHPGARQELHHLLVRTRLG